MSVQTEGASGRVIELLKAEPPELDDLRRARMERRFVDAAASRTGAGALAEGIEVRATAGPRRIGRRVWVGATATVVAAAAAAMFAMRAPGPSYSIERVRGGDIAAGTVIEVALGEEARASVFDLALTASAGASLRFTTVTRDDIRLELSEGEAHFAFHPAERGREHVSIETPSARVDVVGTEFVVRVSDSGTDVSVSEGRVRVVPSNGEAPSFVGAGESLHVGVAVESESVGHRPSPATSAASELPADHSPPVEIVAPATGTETVATTAVSLSARLERVEMLLDRDPTAARRELRELSGAGFPRSVRVEALNFLGESYRDGSQIDDALRAYSEAARLGRGTASGATAIYDGARLSERAGDVESARAGYERYLREYPDGANAVQVRSRLGALLGPR